ncbi:MAG: TVP38/TMEM64 family protein [Selenomonadaceae bacterium]|nr:TVP38/TMEM64 family protein [Selenomonadaceae bacterium]
MLKVKIAAALLIVALFGAIHLAAPEFLPEVCSLLARGDIVETADYIASYGSLAVVFSFLLTLFVNAIGFPPAIIFSTANTLIFGIVPGIILSVVAETVGVTISFQLLRFFFRDSARKIIAKSKKLQSIDKYSSKNGFKVMLIARMVPYIPSGILNAAGALSSLSLYDYFLASLIGKFPSTSIEAIIGHDAILNEEGYWRIVISVILAIVLIVWAWRYDSKHH